MKMERDLESITLTSEQASAHPLIPTENHDESNFSSVFSDGSLQTLIPLPSSDVSIASPNFSFFNEDFHEFTVTQKYQPPPQLPDNSYFYSDPSLYYDSEVTTTQLLDFFSKPTNLSCNYSNTTPSLSSTHLPGLRSLEQASSSSTSNRKKRGRFNLAATNPQTLDSIVQSSFNFQSYIPSPDGTSPHRELARQRRQRISDKTRCLQRLMPWDKKMDTATLLEEAYKYVQFLQAQIKALQSMPIDSSFGIMRAPSPNESGGININGMSSLGRLNRQQLLQVMVNSPVAQTMLYSQGFCVLSNEQLLLLAQRKAVLQHLLFDPR